MRSLEKIRKQAKIIFDLIDNEKLKKNLLNALPFWIGAFISGAIAVLYAKLFSLAEQGTRMIYENADKNLFFILSPVCFIIAWWLVVRFSNFAKGSGIPQVIAAIELSNPRNYYKVKTLLSLKVIFVKILSSLVMVFGGGVVGREGPMIQISAAIFKKINDLLPDWYPKLSKRNMIITGAAAGLASAFNTPLGGIVFAIEELTKTHLNFFKSALLTGVIIAGLTALYFLGPYLYLGYPLLDDVSAMAIIVIIPLAIVTGLTGSAMGRLILFILKRKRVMRKQYQRAIYAGICGLVIAAAAVFIDFDAFGSGKDVMVNTLFTDEKNLEWYIPILRIFGSVISFSVGASGGIFAPALSSGASIGAVFAGWFNLTDAETNLIILCGMTGFLTSITSSPFTSSILVLEMTNSHKVIFYIMLTALIANLFAKAVSRHSFYENLKDRYLVEIKRLKVKRPVKTSPDT